MKLINKIVFLGALFSFCANAAQVNIGGAAAGAGNYVYNNAAGAWQRGAGGVALTAATLHAHLTGILAGTAPAPAAGGIPAPNGAVDCVRELARMLLTQIPTYVLPAGNVDHNNANNNNPNYTVAPLQTNLPAVAIGPAGPVIAGVNNSDDIYRNCDDLKEHMLFHGHLGYYPCLSFIPGRSPCAVNQLSARGIFNIPFPVANRITNYQKIC